MSDASTYPFPLSDAGHGGGREGLRWEIVARTMGILPATVMAGRLQAAGIPARAWQDNAGQALAMNVGHMGTGFVAVPADLVEQALEILADVANVDEEE